MKSIRFSIGILVVLIALLLLLQTLNIVNLGSSITTGIVIIFIGLFLLFNRSIFKNIGEYFKDSFYSKSNSSNESIISNESNVSSESIVDFLSFRYMISSKLISVIYFLGMLALIIFGLNFMVKGDEGILFGIGILLLGNILWRIICELWILLFSIHDVLISIEKSNRKPV